MWFSSYAYVDIVRHRNLKQPPSPDLNRDLNCPRTGTNGDDGDDVLRQAGATDKCSQSCGILRWETVSRRVGALMKKKMKRKLLA